MNIFTSYSISPTIDPYINSLTNQITEIIEIYFNFLPRTIYYTFNAYHSGIKEQYENQEEKSSISPYITK